MARSIVATVSRRATRLDPVAERLQQAASRVLTRNGAPTPLKSFLNGVWLGHALHPALTDVPVGAWTATVALDALSITGSGGLQAAADTTLVLGVAGAAGAAFAGVADWSDTSGETRRLVLVHAMLNSLALGLNLWSLAKRWSGHRGAGVLLSTTAYGIASASAYLGGDLTFARGMGVNHQIWPEPPAEFTPVIEEAALQDGRPVRGHAGEVPVCLVRRNGHIVAFEEWCPHLGGPLAEGQFHDGTVTCPWHGSRFDLETGAVANGPATMPVRTFETRLRDGKIEVRAAGTG